MNIRLRRFRRSANIVAGSLAESISDASPGVVEIGVDVDAALGTAADIVAELDSITL